MNECRNVRIVAWGLILALTYARLKMRSAVREDMWVPYLPGNWVFPHFDASHPVDAIQQMSLNTPPLHEPYMSVSA
jgi:hypothetical protein